MEWECPECGEQHKSIPERCSACGNEPEIRANVWRCQHCGEEGIPGTTPRCPACNADRKLGDKVAVGAGERLTGERARALASGRWLYCAFCDVQVPPVDDEGKVNEACPACQGPLSQAEKEAAVETVAEEDAGSYGAEAVDRVGGAPRSAEMSGSLKQEAPPKKGRGALVLVAVLAVIGLLIWLLFFKTWEKPLVVEQRSWERTVEVQALGPVQEEAWQNELPAGAYHRSCKRKIHHHDKVADGTEKYQDKVQSGKRCVKHALKSKGGVSVKQCARWEKTYKTVTKTRTRYRKVPVYKQRCAYTVDKWHRTNALSTSGSGDQAPTWPDTSNLDGKTQRLGKRGEKYTLVLRKPDGSTLSHQLAKQASWDPFKLKAAVVAEVSTTGEIKALKLAD